MATNGSRSDSNAIKALENSPGLQAICNYINRIHKRAVVLSVIFVLNPLLTLILSSFMYSIIDKFGEPTKPRFINKGMVV